MKSNKEATAKDIFKISEDMKKRFAESDETIQDAEEIMKWALSISEEALKELEPYFMFSGDKNTVKVLRRLMSSVYLSAIAEVIKEKQSYREKTSTRQASYSANGAKDSKVEDVMVVHNSK